MNETLLTVDQAVLLATLVGALFGAIGALIAAKSMIRTYKIREQVKFQTLINSAMENAYKAGYGDGKSKKSALI
jgi:hypothetical protein